MKVIRCSGQYLLFNSGLYFILSLICLLNINVNDFYKSRIVGKTPDYAKEIYWYSLWIERMKVVHSLCLLAISVFLSMMTARNQRLTEQHYKKILMATIFVTVLFFIPFGYIMWASYYDESVKNMVFDPEVGDYVFKYDAVNKDSSHWTALLRFGDWILMMILREDMGIWGLIANVIIMWQIYFLLFILQWCTMQVHNLVEQIKKVREVQAGYTGFELLTP